MFHELGDHPAAEVIDDRHEVVGADWLSQMFGSDVTAPSVAHLG